jgi:hypothetical protein
MRCTRCIHCNRHKSQLSLFAVNTQLIMMWKVIKCNFKAASSSIDFSSREKRKLTDFRPVALRHAFRWPSLIDPT